MTIDFSRHFPRENRRLAGTAVAFDVPRKNLPAKSAGASEVPYRVYVQTDADPERPRPGGPGEGGRAAQPASGRHRGPLQPDEAGPLERQGHALLPTPPAVRHAGRG